MEKGSRIPNFKDISAWDEDYGLDRGYLSPRQLPGGSWAEGNMFDSNMRMPNCNIEDSEFDDALWSRHGNRLRFEAHPRDNVLIDIFHSDAVRRLQAVEQLTLPPNYSTVPNTGAFSRFEHIWGSVLFVRQMAEKAGIDPDQSIRLQLRTLLSDLAHTLGSHLGDWMEQGVGASEDHHDNELLDYLEKCGICDILRTHGFEPTEVIFPDVNDWIEASSPDLCVDRVDYGLREMNRTNPSAQWENFSANDFTITPENMLAMTDQRKARVFAEAYLLLSQENWGEPTHQFIEELLLLRTKLFYATGGSPDMWVLTSDPSVRMVPLHEIHPRDLMYVTDPAQAAAFARPSLSGNIFDSIMATISQYHRQYVWPGKSQRMIKYMNQFAGGNYHQVMTSGTYEPISSDQFGSYLNEYPPTLPTGFIILPKDEAEATKGTRDIDFELTPFKLRQIDPLVQSGATFKRLSELDPSYARRLAEHKQHMQQQRVARINVPDTATYNILNDTINHVEEEWRERLQTSRRLNAKELKALIRASAHEIHGRYPFMSFISY